MPPQCVLRAFYILMFMIKKFNVLQIFVIIYKKIYINNCKQKWSKDAPSLQTIRRKKWLNVENHHQKDLQKNLAAVQKKELVKKQQKEQLRKQQKDLVKEQLKKQQEKQKLVRHVKRARLA